MRVLMLEYHLRRCSENTTNAVNNIWRDIEVVITRRLENRLSARARGFESHSLPLAKSLKNFEKVLDKQMKSAI